MRFPPCILPGFRVVALLLASMAGLSATEPKLPDPRSAVFGVWWTPRHDGKIEISETDGVVTGRLIASTPALSEKPDSLNEEPGLRDRKLLGSSLFLNFRWNDGSQRWEGGTAYDPGSGKTYKAMLWCETAGELRMRGYIGFSLLGRTESFERVAGANPRQHADGEPILTYEKPGADGK